MVHKYEMENRYIKRLDEIEEQVKSVKEMVNGGFLNSTSSFTEQDFVTIWLECLDEVKKIMDLVDKTMFDHQNSSDGYPDENCPF